jgi:hypothetical protein
MFSLGFLMGLASMIKLLPSRLASTFRSLSKKGSTMSLNLDGMVNSHKFRLDSAADLHIYDMFGRHTGLNYETGQLDLEIPGSAFEFEDYSQIVTIEHPIAGDYYIEIKGTADGTYTLTISGFYFDQTISEESYSKDIKEGEAHGMFATVGSFGRPITIVTTEPKPVPVMAVEPATMHLVGSPGETLEQSFFVKETGGAQGITDVAVSAENLVDLHGNMISAANFNFMPQKFDVPNGSAQEVIMTLNVPDDVILGDYSGYVLIDSTNAGSKRLSLFLRVTTITLDTWMTDSDFNNITSFRCVFTPDKKTRMYVLTATNPGQFYFNILVNNTGIIVRNITVTYNIDSKFTMKGANPIHVYTDLDRTIDITANCTFVDNAITAYNVAPNAIVYVTIHLDYTLKGTKWTKSEVEAWYSQHTFSATADSVESSVTITDPEAIMPPLPNYIVFLIAGLPTIILYISLIVILLKYMPLTIRRRKEN